MLIVVTSKNPVKRNATLKAFTALFPDSDCTLVEISVLSDVKEQPMTEEEALQGAKNRVKHARQKIPDADFWVGIEGGVEMKAGEMETFAWVYIENKNSQAGKGRTGTFFLPKKIIELIHKGKELGDADDIVFNKTNTKQKMGTIGNLTRNVIDRTEYYRQAVMFALIPFVNKDLY